MNITTMLEAKTHTVGDNFTLRSIRDTSDGWHAIELERDGNIVEIEADEVSALTTALMALR